MNQEKKKNAKKLPGFYIALCCCVLMIGIAGYFTEMSTDKTTTVINSEVMADSTESPIIITESDTYIPPAMPTEVPVMAQTAQIAEETTETIPVVSEPQPIEEYAVDNPDTQNDAITVTSEQPAFIMPVTGNILEEYSDTLKYNNALADWRTHNGIDIAAEKGCSVQSVSNGIVDSVSEDVMGNCVVISHAAGFVTKYMGLETVENLTVGKEVQSGEVIGIVGDSKGENVTDTHLHFEMTKDGENVNPSDYLPH